LDKKRIGVPKVQVLLGTEPIYNIWNLFSSLFIVFYKTLYLYTDGRENPQLPITTRVVEEGKSISFNNV